MIIESIEISRELIFIPSDEYSDTYQEVFNVDEGYSTEGMLKELRKGITWNYAIEKLVDNFTTEMNLAETGDGIWRNEGDIGYVSMRVSNRGIPFVAVLQDFSPNDDNSDWYVFDEPVIDLSNIRSRSFKELMDILEMETNNRIGMKG